MCWEVLGAVLALLMIQLCSTSGPYNRVAIPVVELVIRALALWPTPRLP